MNAVAWILVAVLGTLLCAMVLRDRWRAAGRRRAARRRSQRAADGERDAAGLLADHGYRILEAQAELTWMIAVDGAPHEVGLRADYVVARGGHRWVAEVKTGQRAPSLGSAATRRQLLEYAVAYDVSGVLLVDMEARALHSVDFALGSGSSQAGWWPWLCFASLAIGLAAGLAL